MTEQAASLSIDTRLDNWASSARGRYDAADAALVDHAWRRLAPHYKELLRMAYQWHAGREVICRRLKIPRRPWHKYELELAAAKHALVNQLAAATSS